MSHPADAPEREADRVAEQVMRGGELSPSANREAASPVERAVRAYMQTGRAAAGRTSEPTAAVIDSQPVRATDTVPRASRGWDNAKTLNSRTRHIAVDTQGLLLAVVITAASVQDRDGARPLLRNLHWACRRIQLIWADAVHTGSSASGPPE